jgi:hypothetical protein
MLAVVVVVVTLKMVQTLTLLEVLAVAVQEVLQALEVLVEETLAVVVVAAGAFMALHTKAVMVVQEL